MGAYAQRVGRVVGGALLGMLAGAGVIGAWHDVVWPPAPPCPDTAAQLFALQPGRFLVLDYPDRRVLVLRPRGEQHLQYHNWYRDPERATMQSIFDTGAPRHAAPPPTTEPSLETSEKKEKPR